MTWESDQSEMARLQERVRIHLGHNSKPSTAKTRDYYREMANDATVPIKQRRLWKQLADEMDSRVGTAEPENPETDGLW